MDHPLGGYGPALLVMFWKSRVLQEAFLDVAKGCVDSAKLTERLTLKVYALAANNQLQKTDRKIKVMRRCTALMIKKPTLTCGRVSAAGFDPCSRL
jgi:hypothetical protein